VSERTVPDQPSPDLAQPQSHQPQAAPLGEPHPSPPDPWSELTRAERQAVDQAARRLPLLQRPVWPPSNPVYLEQMLATLSAIAMMLAARFILMMSAIGSFTLAYLAIQQATTMTLIAAGTFDVLVVIPLVALYWHRG